MPDWQAVDQLRLLRELTFYYMLRNADGAGLNITTLLRAIAHNLPDAMRHEVDAWRGGIGAPASYHALERFLHFESRAPARTAVLDALFRHVVGWFADNEADPKLRKSRYPREIKGRGADWFAALGKANVQTTPSAPSIPLEDVFQMCADYLKIDTVQATRAASRELTGREECVSAEPTDVDRQGYETYRYSVRPGRVVKTFTVFTPPSATRPFCTFYNVYRGENGEHVKYASGVVLKLEVGIYCVGRLHDSKDSTSSGLKIVALPHQVWGGDLLHGFIITRDEDARILVARTALKRSQAKTHQDCVPTVIPFESVSTTVPEPILRRIRNTIDFEVEELIYCNETKRHIDAGDMVRIVDELCGNRFTLGGRRFNPASHAYYPFNQALVPFAGREPFMPWATKSEQE